MHRYTPAARIWMGFIIAAAAFLVFHEAASSLSATGADLLAFTILAGCGAIAHLFPIRSVFQGASIRMTSVFMVAGAMVLPGGLLPLFPLAAITPDSWRRRHSPGAWIHWLFNVAQTALALEGVRAVLVWSGATEMATIGHFLGLLIAAALFTVTQAGVVGITVALHSHIPINRAETFALPYLLGDMQAAVIGLMLGGLWLIKPALLGLVLPLVVVAYRLTQSVNQAYLAQIDGKTGLNHYGYFEHMLEEELTRSSKLGRPLAVLFVDLDLLREINSRYGHLAGDKVLQQVAAVLASQVCASELVARFGGEEFVALLPATDSEEAIYRAERLRKAVADHPFEIDANTTIRCTVSIGVAVCPEDAKTIHELMDRAGTAMFRAKQTRNAVARAKSLPPVPRVSQRKPDGGADGPGAWRSEPSIWAHVVLWATAAAGGSAIVVSLWVVYQRSAWYPMLMFAAAGVVAELFRVRVYEAKGQTLSLSLGIGATLAAVTFYPVLAPITSLFAATAHVLRSGQRQPDKVLFNLTNPPLAAAGASAVYLWMRPELEVFGLLHLGAAAVAVLVCHLINFGTVSLMIALHSSRKVRDVVRTAGWQGPIKHMIALTGAFIGGAFTEIGWVGSIMFVVPLFVLRFTMERSARSSEQAIAILQAAKNEVEHAHLEKEATLSKLIDMLSAIIDARDNSVYGHSGQVARYAVALGQELGLSETDLSMVHAAALLHDLGKVGIPEAILHKPGRLTPDEYEVIKQHSGIGERILGEAGALSEVGRMVGDHHEHFDGGGYPRGKRSEEITLGGRILSVVDTLDSILSDRPYSKGQPLAWALAEIDRCTGTQFDPLVVQALHRVVDVQGPDFFVNSAAAGIPKEELPAGACSPGRVS